MKKLIVHFIMIAFLAIIIMLENGCAIQKHWPGGEHKHGKKIPPTSAFQIFPSPHGKKALIPFSSIPIGHENRFFYFTVATNQPYGWELASASYSVDGKSWRKISLDKRRKARLKNRHDNSESSVTLRAYFKRSYQGIDPSTGKPFPVSIDLVGPIYYNFKLWHN